MHVCPSVYLQVGPITPEVSCQVLSREVCPDFGDSNWTSGFWLILWANPFLPCCPEVLYCQYSEVDLKSPICNGPLLVPDNILSREVFFVNEDNFPWMSSSICKNL